MEVWRSAFLGCIDVCRYTCMKVWRYDGMAVSIWRLDAWKVWTSGGPKGLKVRGDGGIEVWSCEGMEI
jgi:hypothetical protein